MIVRAALSSLLLAAPAVGQEMAQGGTVILRALDRIAGETAELRIDAGQEIDYGRLRIGLRDCRYPAENPAADAFAWLEIEDTRLDQRLFAGWMVASSPALNALDHVRYDVWVIGCQ